MYKSSSNDRDGLKPQFRPASEILMPGWLVFLNTAPKTFLVFVFLGFFFQLRWSSFHRFVNPNFRCQKPSDNIPTML